MNKRLILLVAVVWCAVVAFAQDSVVLLIGDGMGPVQVQAASLKLHGEDGKLAMQGMPVTGTITTHSADNKVTDSAAGGTALACGAKTNNGMIGVAPDGARLKSILEICRDAGKSTGLVATSTITHATPASFAAHIDSRKKEAEIAVQMIEAKVDVLFGGGWRYFVPHDHQKSKREDSRDLLGEAALKGYKILWGEEDFQRDFYAPVIGLFDDGSLDGHGEPTLAELAAKALEKLGANEKGFFLMVEGSKIDWACHDNDEAYFYGEIASFDAAVKKALDFAAADGDVLVVVTADHETGGMTLTEPEQETGEPVADEASEGKQAPVLGWTTKGHTDKAVPVFAFGPGAEAFAGNYDNTDIPKKLAAALGLVMN